MSTPILPTLSNYNLLSDIICFFTPLQLFDLLSLNLSSHLISSLSHPSSIISFLSLLLLSFFSVSVLILILISPPPGLHCTNCAVRRSSPGQIPATVATLCHLEPDPGSVGIHPVSQVSSSENLPPPQLVSGLHHDPVPVFQRHHSQVHALLAWEHHGPRWNRRDREIKCNGYVFTEAPTSFSVIGCIWAVVAADWVISLVVACVWMCFRALINFHVNCDQYGRIARTIWLFFSCMPLKCLAVLAMTL